MRIATLTVLSLLSGALFTGGCARVTAETTVPLYDARNDLKFDPRFLGVWLPDTECVNFKPGQGNAYTVGKGGMAYLVIFGDALNKGPEPDSIHLVKIGKFDYFFAAPKAGEAGTVLTGCCKVEYLDDHIILHGLNLQAVIDDLQKHPGALKHEWAEQPTAGERFLHPTSEPATQPTTQPATRPTTEPGAPAAPTTCPAPGPGELHNGDLKITDDAKAVQAYLTRHQDDGEFFSDPVVLYRVAK